MREFSVQCSRGMWPRAVVTLDKRVAAPIIESGRRYKTLGVMKSRICGVIGFAALAIVVASADNNWPQFRGAQAGVAADDPLFPDSWDATHNVIWKMEVPGRSWSSPVVWGDHVFITTAINEAEDALKPVSTYVSRSNGGTMTFRDITKPAGL